MAVSYESMDRLLATNVLEIRFRRRHEKLGWSWSRRMLCTNSKLLLNSLVGKMTLHFSPPTQPPPYNYYSKNLIAGWDILMQEYRAIPLDAVDIVGSFELHSTDDVYRFWDYFTTYIVHMSKTAKKQFMDR